MIDRYSKIIKDFLDDAVTLTSDSPSKNDDLEIDNATVAVMERLNLHDILVRIPMNHGELGPNSKVGHADHLCSRKMNKVPLSDFFAAPFAVRESQMNQGGIKSSLWMSDSQEVVDSKGSSQMNDDAEEECAIEQSKNVIDEDKRIETKTKVNKKGMSPTDPAFLAMTVGFLLCINFSSRIW